MMLTEESQVPAAALALDRFKDHLRLATGFDAGDLQDGILEGFLRAALSAVEARTGKALIERNFALSLTGWRSPAGQALPLAPVSAVTAVHLIDATGTETEVDADTYWLEADTHRPCLRPRGAALPSIPTNGRMRVRFVAGYGPSFDDLAPDLAQAVFLLAAHYYEYRHEVSLGEGCMPFGVTSLIERYRHMRLSGGGV